MAKAKTPNMDYAQRVKAPLKPPTREPVYWAGLYYRISKVKKDSDGENGQPKQDESISIEYQREILVAYANEHGYRIYDEYVDDGERGVIFEREDFQRMLDDIKAGHINMVLTKDLSRFGRNYSIGGYYRDEFFPKHNVRYISVDGQYDGDREDNDIAPFIDMFNEHYAKQTSKKVRATRKVAAAKGYFMGSIPTYGYRRSETDRHKLVIDSESGTVVRRIFDLFKRGESARHIADLLTGEGILTPQEYYYHSEGKENPFKQNAKTWSAGTVTNILKSDTYLGHTTQGQRRVRSYKDPTILQLPKEDWVTVENTHEPLVEPEVFAEIQTLFRKNKNSKPRRTKMDGEASLFSNIVKCMDCRSNMAFSSSQRVTFVDHYYRCSRYVQHGYKECKPHRIPLDTLNAVVLEDIRNNARLAKEDEEAFVQRLHSISMKERSGDIERKRKRVASIRNRLREIDTLVKKTFEKNISGVLPDSVFATLVKDYESEKSGIEVELSGLQVEIQNLESQTSDVSREIENLKRHAEITELTRKIVTNLIKVIYVSEPKKIDGEKVFDIEIRYRFQSPCIESAEAKDTKKEDTPYDDEVSSDNSSKAVAV